MQTEQNKAVVRRFHELFSQHDLEGCLICLHPELVASQAGLPGMMDLLAFRDFGGAFMKAFPDLQEVVEEIYAEGDEVVSRGRLIGTQKGPYQGIPVTGRQVNFEWVNFDRFKAGKIIRHHGVFDSLTVLVQLGVLPIPAGA